MKNHEEKRFPDQNQPLLYCFRWQLIILIAGIILHTATRDKMLERQAQRANEIQARQAQRQPVKNFPKAFEFLLDKQYRPGR